MKQCVNARCKFNKCAEVCHTCHFSCDHFSYREILCSICPRIRLRELQAERDLRVMDILNKYSELVSYMEKLLRIVNPSP